MIVDGANLPPSLLIAVTFKPEESLQELERLAGISLLFAAGHRPSADEFERLLASPELDGAASCVSFRPEDDEGWLELLVSGLTFDVLGLAQGDGAQMVDNAFRFGLSEQECAHPLEAVMIVPGEHIAGGANALPVVRALIGLAASIAMPLSAFAVCWNPVRSWMEPGYFVRISMNWLSGGAFPALGLTALEKLPGDDVLSHGLDYFIGQEFRLGARTEETPAETMKIAVRLIDYMVRRGPFTEIREVEGMAGETLVLDPGRSGDLVTVWRRQ